MSSLPPDHPAHPQPLFQISYERRLLAPGAEWVPIFRVGDHPCGYGVNLWPAAKGLVLARDPELDRGVVHLRLELHQGIREARAAAGTAREHFDALGYPGTRVRVQGVEIVEAKGAEPPALAAFATLAVVRHPKEWLPRAAILPWVTRRDRREGPRHSVVGLTHELYVLLAEVSDCLVPYDDGQFQRWRFGPALSTVFSHGPVTVYRHSPACLRVQVERLRLASEEDDGLARAACFAEFLAALRCHPAIWGVNVSVGAEADGVASKTLTKNGFEEIDPEEDMGEEVRQWILHPMVTR